MRKITEKITEFSATKRLIDAMADFALENCWSDEDFIEALFSCGITATDFYDCGYGEFFENHFKED